MMNLLSTVRTHLLATALSVSAASLLVGCASTTNPTAVPPAAIDSQETALSEIRDLNVKPDTCSDIYLSDATTGTVYMYQGNAPGHPPANPSSLPPTIGQRDTVGVYATKAAIYAPRNQYRIAVYPPCRAGQRYHLNTNRDAPIGNIAVDRSGDVYAVEYGTTTIDCFNPPPAPNSGPPPRCHDTNMPATNWPSVGAPYSYLATDTFGNVWVSGWFNFTGNTNDQAEVDWCGAAPGTLTCHTCEVLAAPSWPGGIVVDNNPYASYLIVNNQFGSLYTYKLSYTGSTPTCPNGPPTHSVVYGPGFATNNYTAITLDSKRQYLWAANQINAACNTDSPQPFCVQAQAQTYNMVTGVISPPGTNITPIITGNQPGGGIAVWPPPV